MKIDIGQSWAYFLSLMLIGVLAPRSLKFHIHIFQFRELSLYRDESILNSLSVKTEKSQGWDYFKIIHQQNTYN